MKHWSEIAPRDAVEIELPHHEIIGPINEAGAVCPWPWDPQQLGGAPLGQYHCPYCGGMQIAGVRHLDHRGKLYGVNYREYSRERGVWI